MFHSLGLSGLEELEKIDVRFSEFRNSLFALSSKQFERSVHTEEVNKKIDEEIEKFLVLISPYFTLKSSQKALEWLVNRYHVQQFNTDAWIMCVMPFHDTKIFVRAIQLPNLKNQFSKWHWLYPLQRPGIPLPRNTLLNACAQNVGLLKLICSQLEKATQIHSEKQSVLNVFIAFYTTTIIGMLELSNGITEEQLAIILPSLLSGLVCKFPDLVAGCYMIIAQLNRKAKLSPRVAEEFAASILKVLPFISIFVILFYLVSVLQGMIPSLTLEAVTLLTVLCNKQDPKVFRIAQIKRSSKFLISNSQLLASIGSLASTYQVSSFVSTMIEDFLTDLGRDTNDGRFVKTASFLTKLVEDVRFVGQDTTVVIKYTNSYLFRNSWFHCKL